MKKLIVLVILSVVSGTSFAQNFEAPKQGAKIYLSSNEVGMNIATASKVDIWVVRSKKAKKSNFDAPKFLGASDMGISIEADENDPNHFVATLNAAGVKNGKYFYTVSSRSRSVQKVTSATLAVVVGTTETVTKNN